MLSDPPIQDAALIKPPANEMVKMWERTGPRMVGFWNGTRWLVAGTHEVHPIKWQAFVKGPPIDMVCGSGFKGSNG